MGEDRREIGEHSVLNRINEKDYWLVKALVVNLWTEEGHHGIK